MPRNSFFGPGYFNTDLSVHKSFSFTEAVKLRLGVDAFNLFNHANFANPNSDVAGGGLGQITATVTPPSSPYGSFMGSAVSGAPVRLLAWRDQSIWMPGRSTAPTFA